jgi:formylglycine-generating enzyme required for sulfatase activity
VPFESVRVCMDATPDSGATDAAPLHDGGARDSSSETGERDAKGAPPRGPKQSCQGLPRNCGASGIGDCCESPVVTGGSFNRDNDPAFPATVSDFQLDKYLVTVGRFRKFAEAYPGSRPKDGDGAHPKIPGSGWQASIWDETDLPRDRTALTEPLREWGYSDAPGANDEKPIAGLTWYEAFAFCAWDGGRLPTEAEWNYAAAGGSEQRKYPWGSDAPDGTRWMNYRLPADSGTYPLIDPKQLVDVTMPVGSFPAGDGKYGQSDLVGARGQWALDAVVDPYKIVPCNDCAELERRYYLNLCTMRDAFCNQGGPYGRARRGAYWVGDPTEFETSVRGNAEVRCGRMCLATLSNLRTSGVRCARDINPVVSPDAGRAVSPEGGVDPVLPGQVWACGDNTFGQLGDGTFGNRTTPVRVKGLTDVTAVSAGAYHSLALKSDGTVWSWGRNDVGQLGDGTKEDRLEPVQITGLSSVVAVFAGLLHSLVVKNDGTVWAWGFNSTGQLGDGTTVNRSSPVPVLNVTSIVSVGAGWLHSFAVDDAGALWGWGDAGYDQLGAAAGGALPCDAASFRCVLPGKIGGLNPTKSAGGSNDQSFVLDTSGVVWSWGLFSPNRSPGVGPGITGVTVAHVSSNNDYLAVRDDGTVWIWGRYSDGLEAYASPVKVPIDHVVDAVVGEMSGVALKDDGTLWGWGENHAGQLGNGSFGFEGILAPSTTADPQGGLKPTVVQTMTRFNGKVRALSAHGHHTLVLTK